MFGKFKILFTFLIVTFLLSSTVSAVLIFHGSFSTQVDAAHRVNRIRRITPTPTLKPTATPTPTIRLKPTNTPTPTPKPTATPTLKPTAIATPTPTVTPTSPSTTQSIPDYLLSQINDYRKLNGLSTVTSNDDTCSFAAVRAQEISTAFSHDGFNNRVSSHTMPYTYHEVTENIAMNSNYKNVVTSWINSPGHAENMRKDTPYVCVAKNGNYYAYEGLRP